MGGEKGKGQEQPLCRGGEGKGVPSLRRTGEPTALEKLKSIEGIKPTRTKTILKVGQVRSRNADRKGKPKVH